MQVKITKLNPADDKHYDRFVAVKFNVSHVVMHRHHMILVIDASAGHIKLCITHKQRLFVASIYNVTSDQAIKAAVAFFEAVKAGHDSFEVQ